MRRLLLWLSETGGKATRLDLAIDDYERRVLPSDVRASILRGELVSRTQNASYRETLRGSGGDTVYVGARTSRVMLRIYDKRAESGGLVDSVRWELVLREEGAQAVQHQLTADAWAPIFNAQLVRFADFKDPTSGTRSTRRIRMAWYAEIVDNAHKAAPYMPQPVYNADKAMQHFRRNQAPMLAALIASEGGSVDFVFQAVRDGRKRWRRKHEIIASDFGI